MGTQRDKLLVLDDEQLVRTSLEDLFEDDYEVFATADAETALRFAQGRDIAVILCGERISGVSVHEFLRRAKEISGASRILMSRHADISALTQAVNIGQIFALVAKPWDPLRLRAEIEAAAVHFKLVHEVEKERELLRALMENIPDLIYFKDREFRFTRVNQAFVQTVQAKDAAECIGKSYADYFDSPDAPQRWLEEEEIVRSGQPQIDRVERLLRPHGDLRWMSTTKVPMLGRGGNVSGIAGISRDITVLKNSEEMLREQNERNRMILHTAYDAFIGMEPNGTITAWNPQAERTFGWAAAEAIGRTLCDTVVAPAYRAAHAHGVEQFLSGTQGSLLNRVIDLVALHRDGHEFPVEATVWPVRVGGTLSFNAFVRDITERLRAEDARKKETTLIQLLQSVTTAANRSSTIEHTAKTCLTLVGSYIGWPVCHVYLRAKPSNELVSAGIWHLQDPERFAAFREAADRDRILERKGLPGLVLATGLPQWVVSLADEQPMSERTRVAVEAGLRSGFAFPVIVEEEVIGILEFFSQHTVQPDEEFLNILGNIGSQLGQVIKRQRAEEDLLRAKASAESANLAKSEFLTTMSHEMRTPMNAILGMADLLSESSLQEEQRGYVEIFQKAGANLLDLINDSLDLSKVESGHVELESIDFDLGALLKRVVAMMVSRARDRGLQLTLDVMPGVPLGLVGDPNRLRQILLNLIGNALKFTERGSVTLRVELEPDGTAGWLRFNIADTGIGIAPDKVEMIFERFTQADSSTTRKYGGTGLGLAISKGLAELMGGRLGCTSELGNGSTFFFTAPFVACKMPETPKGTKPAQVEIPSKKSGGPHLRILLAEDSEYNVVLIKAYLKNSGFTLDVAENGKIAVEKAIADRPDLILMDLQMPVMDGLEATRAIRLWETTTHAHPMPILALTAHAEGEGVGRSLEAGCSEHLTKPIKKATLMDAISRHTKGKICVTPPEGIEEFVPNYLASVRRDMAAILAGIEAKDCKIAGLLGHQFKGTGQGYGFPEITRTGAAVELAAHEANESEIRRQILALASYLDRVEIVAR